MPVDTAGLELISKATLTFIGTTQKKQSAGVLPIMEWPAQSLALNYSSVMGTEKLPECQRAARLRQYTVQNCSINQKYFYLMLLMSISFHCKSVRLSFHEFKYPS